MAAAMASSILCAGVASGNGRFPQAGYVVSGPGALGDVVLVRATFGLVVSDDGGQRFRFHCEDAFEASEVFDPAVAVSGTGALMVGLADGLMLARDWCAPRRVEDLRNQSVTDLATDLTGRTVFAALVSRDATPVSRVARSTDAGEHFEVPREGVNDVRFVTVDVAPSDGRRIYATGAVGVGAEPALFRSDDMGVTWRRSPARFGDASGVFVAAVDPRRAEVLYLRSSSGALSIDGGSGGGASVLYRSDDGGDTLREVARTVGPMRGFALSGDGRSVWIAGPNPADGLRRSDDGGPWETLAREPLECLRWHAGTLWMCRTLESSVSGAVMLYRSDDGGRTRSVALRYDAIEGPPTRCAAGTVTREVCPSRWAEVRRTIATIARPDGGTGDRGPAMDVGSTRPPPDCHCRGATSATSRSAMWLVLVALALRPRRS